MNIIAKLPMIEKEETKKFYQSFLNFEILAEFDDYLIIQKNEQELHFFLFKELDKFNNYSSIYIRIEKEIEKLYNDLVEKNVTMPVLGKLEQKFWGQIEFSIIDPTHNLITFGQIKNNL